MSTIKDVAKAAGVSISTVSLTMNFPDRVSEDTKQRVFKAMKDLQYTPSTASKTVRKRREDKKSIALFSCEISGPYFFEVFRGMAEALAVNGLNLIMLCGADAERRHFTEMVHNPHVCGIILLEANDLSQRDFDEARRNHVPIVMTNTKSEIASIGSVSIDNYYIGELAANHFYHLGYRRICVIGNTSKKDRYNRVKGFIDTLAKHNIEIPPNWRIPIFLNEKSGYIAMETFLVAENELPEAIFCINDEVALGVINALRHHNIDVPGRVAVMGCDDISVSKFATPPLTTIDMPKFEIGMLSVTQLLLQTNGKPAENITLNAKLIVRESCGFGYKKKN